MAGPSGRVSRRLDVADWEDDWVDPSDEDTDDPDLPDMCEHELAAAERALAAAGPRSPRSPRSPPSRPATLGVQGASECEVPAAGTPSSAARRDSQLTDRGYFDVKYYHNRLW